MVNCKLIQLKNAKVGLKALLELKIENGKLLQLKGQRASSKEKGKGKRRAESPMVPPAQGRATKGSVTLGFHQVKKEFGL